MNKIKLLSLAIIISISANSFAANKDDEETPDLKRADICFRIVEDGIKLGTEIAVEQKNLKQKAESLAIWKHKIDKETKIVEDYPGVRLNRLKADIQKYKKAEVAFKIDETKFDKKMTQFKDNKEQNIKKSCNKTKFSDDAIEQICTISKKYPLACAEVLKNEN